MKFLTSQWWADNDSDPTVFKRYEAHCRLFWDKLPKDFKRIHRFMLGDGFVDQNSISLHDAHIRKLHVDLKSRLASIQLDVDDEKGGLRRITLCYEDVLSIQLNPDTDDAEDGFGDLGYHEVSLVGDSNFQHNILFSNGLELEIIFKNFRLEFPPADDSTA
jgi:hypothetical protein